MKKFFSKEVVATAILASVITGVVIGGVMVWRDNRDNGFKFKKGA